MRKPIAELQKEELRFYDSVSIWFNNGGNRHFTFETTAVKEDKTGIKYIDITDLSQGLYIFKEDVTIHYYHNHRTLLSGVEYYELIDKDNQLRH